MTDETLQKMDKYVEKPEPLKQAFNILDNVPVSKPVPSALTEQDLDFLDQINASNIVSLALHKLDRERPLPEAENPYDLIMTCMEDMEERFEVFSNENEQVPDTELKIKLVTQFAEAGALFTRLISLLLSTANSTDEKHAIMVACGLTPPETPQEGSARNY